MQLYNMPSSGNSYKVRLLLALLGQQIPTVDVEKGSAEIEAAKTAGKLPLGGAPVLHLDDEQMIAESNAILLYLSEGSDWVPEDPVSRAQMLAWMFWEQNQHEGVVAVRGSLRFYPHLAAQATPERMADLLERGNAALARMEQHLADHAWLAGTAPSLADIALYAYTHTAGARGGFDMAQFPAINAWLDRVAALPGYVGLDG